jgi:hypothetical protein
MTIKYQVPVNDCNYEVPVNDSNYEVPVNACKLRGTCE